MELLNRVPLASLLMLGVSSVAQAQTSEQTLSIDVNEPATCRGCQDGVAGCDLNTTYDDMASIGFTFVDAGSNTHEYVTNLDCDAAYVFHVRCRDGSGNTNSVSSQIEFSIDPLVGPDGSNQDGGPPGDPGASGDPGSPGDSMAAGADPHPSLVSGGCNCQAASPAAFPAAVVLLAWIRRSRAERTSRHK